ncbi:hypothetical protein [Flavobacterium sp.]|uniref:hypothetical protein n=1 Tax=Flavobacterium sp. TaxID=239 RepID=UPI0024896F06|nr:hypothetical protein [Flavobacterium sp.]MDI1316712.1 hypothetical protein [Flavobacterium sp.]
MKKLFFTAIALVAFSGISMANTIIKIEFKTVEAINLSLKDQKNTEEAVGPDCVFEKFKAYNAAREAGFSVSDSTSLSYSIYFDCMKNFSIEP